MPVINAGMIDAAVPGDMLLFTGVLVDNAPLDDDLGFVAYSVEEWKVTVPDDNEDSSEPYGRWEPVETVVPALIIQLDGQAVAIHGAAGARLSGALHEEIIKSADPVQATYEGELLPSGSRRYRGLINGDLTTVLGEVAYAKSLPSPLRPHRLNERLLVIP